MMNKAQLMADEVFKSIQKFCEGIETRIGDSVKALAKRIDELPPPKQGDKGEPGKDADTALILDAMSKRLDELVAAIPQPKNGENGKDADPEKIKALVEEAVAALPKPKDGEDGQNGKDADPAVIRKMVDDSIALIEPPQDGRDGKDGAPGRDALQLNILPAIEVTRVYPRGTYAKHDGGLWATHKTTSGMDGWECIVDGIKSLEVVQGADPRDLVVKTALASGATRDYPLQIPGAVDQGLYVDGKRYRKGDGVTWARSYWIATCDTDQTPDDAKAEDKHWRLAVKRGRDGASAFDAALRAGFKGTESQWVASLKGEPGKNARGS